MRQKTSSRLWINHVLDRTMRFRVRSTRKKPEVFKWTQCMEDFVHAQLEKGQQCYPHPMETDSPS